ncbi:MAG: hypothetical protein GX959_03880 [Clostridiales bacterium]|nr:hypothetical protein [Clostridiales bacterium]
MKYLFYDLEYATSKGGNIKICEFGYVVTDEHFNVQERNNFIIDPNISKEEWDWRVVRTILTRKVYEYENSETFPYYYSSIKRLIESADYIIGHSLNGDAKALNDDCQRYEKPSLDYDFYDIKAIFKDYSNTKKDTSVENILIALGINGEENTHDAETDAYNSMLELKKMLDSLGFTFEEIIQLCPNAKDRTENYIVDSIEKARIKREQEFKDNLNGDGLNDIKKYGDNKKRYLQFLDNVKPQGKGKDKFKNKKVSISINYEEHHYRQMLNLVQLIVNEGGQVILKASLSDIFVKYDVRMEDGSLRTDSKLNYVHEANDNGSNIEIIDFDELLERLNITENELDKMPLISFDFLFEDGAIIKDKRDKSYIEHKKKKERKDGVVYSDNSSGTTLGDLFGDLFSKLLDESEDKNED